jgi:hypothetical protein
MNEGPGKTTNIKPNKVSKPPAMVIIIFFIVSKQPNHLLLLLLVSLVTFLIKVLPEPSSMILRL